MRGLENAIVRLLRERPFYGQMLLNFRRESNAAEQALGVTLRNGTPVLGYNPERFAAHSDGERQALLEHVLLHLLHRHPLRCGERHRHDWDIACDLAINPHIEGLPLAAVTPQSFSFPDEETAEEYYRRIHTPFAVGNQEGSGIGRASVDSGVTLGQGGAAWRQEVAEAQSIDDHRLWDEAASTPETLAETVIRSLVQQAWQRSSGEVPAAAVPLLAAWLAPSPIPWKQVLRQFVASAGRVGRRGTWKREHRRFGYITPGLRKNRKLNLLVAIDVSESTDTQPLREAFARELLQIARGREALLTVLYSGSQIEKVETFRRAPQVTEVYRGGGFTDLRPVFDYAQQLMPRPAAVIYLTDGFGEAPPQMLFPTLWVLTREGEKPAPWGVELRISG